jgi:predicted DNA-binding antitoxin AbrB/MazE fold protein
MSQTIMAIYEDGVFKPLQKVNIKPHQKAELIIFPEEETDASPKETHKLVEFQKKALLKLCGKGNSSLADVGRNHDKYLYQKK